MYSALYASCKTQRLLVRLFFICRYVVAYIRPDFAYSRPAFQVASHLLITPTYNYFATSTFVCILR